MKKWVFIVLFIILISMIGCETVPKEMVTPSHSVISQPLLTNWEIIGNPEVMQEGFTCEINGFYFSNQRIFIFYSLSGSTSNKLATSEVLQIIDDSGSVSQLVEMIPLRNIDQLEFGIMVFEPRRIGIRDIYLSVTAKSDLKLNQKIALAHLNGSIADDRVDRTFYGETLKHSELGEYQISILWSAPPENQAGGATSTIFPESTPSSGNRPTPTVVVRSPAISVPPGVFIQFNFSFLVENIKMQQTEYYGVQLYSDGSVASTFKGTTILAAPIVLITPTPTNLSYLPPLTSPNLQPTANQLSSPYP